MTERLTENEKIEIIEEIIETGNQAKVAGKHVRSTGSVSMLWNDFKNGTGLMSGIGIFSDELLDIAKLKRQENITYQALVNYVEDGKLLKDLGIKKDVLMVVANHLKNLSSLEIDGFFDLFNDIKTVKKPGESILTAEKNIKETLQKLEEAKKELGTLEEKIGATKAEKENLDRDKDAISENINFGIEIAKGTGIVQRKNVLETINALKETGFDADEFIKISKAVNNLKEKNINLTSFFNIYDMLQYLMDKGLSIESLNAIEKDLKSTGKSIEDLFNEIKKYMEDRDNYLRDIESLKEERKRLKEEIEKRNRENQDLASENKRLTDQKTKLEIESSGKQEELNGIIKKSGIANDIVQLLWNKIYYDNRYSSAKKNYDELIENIKDAENKKKTLNEELEVYQKQCNDKIQDLKNLNIGITDYNTLTTELDRMKNSLNLQKQEFEKNREKIEIGIEIYDLLSYSDQQDQRELKDLCTKINLRLPYIPNYMPMDLKKRVIEALVNISKDCVVLLNYNNNTIKFENGETYEKNKKEFKETSKIWMEANNLKRETENMLKSFNKNLLQALENAIQTNTLPEKMSILIKNGANDFVTKSYNEAVNKISKENTTDQLGNLIKTWANVFSQIVYEKNAVDEDAKVFKIIVEKNGQFKSLEISISKLADAILNDKDVDAHSWPKVLRALIISQASNKNVPVNTPTPILRLIPAEDKK